MRIFSPRKSSGTITGLLADMILKPLSQWPGPLMPLGFQQAQHFCPDSPSGLAVRSSRRETASAGRTASNCWTPSGRTLASDGASICTAPSCKRLQSSSLSL